MKMLGTNLCPICVDAEAKLKEHGIDIQYSDFANSIVSLKEFIHFRDTHSEFETAKKNSKITRFLFRKVVKTTDFLFEK